MGILKVLRDKKFYKEISSRRKLYSLLGLLVFTSSFILSFANSEVKVKNRKEFFGTKFISLELPQKNIEAKKQTIEFDLKGDGERRKIFKSWINTTLNFNKPFFKVDDASNLNIRKEIYLLFSEGNLHANKKIKESQKLMYDDEKFKENFSKTNALRVSLQRQNKIYDDYLSKINFENDLRLARRYALNFFMIFGLILFCSRFLFIKKSSNNK